MKIQRHIYAVSRSPQKATSNFQIKLESTTMIIDRILLAGRQSPWKAGVFDGSNSGSGTSTGTNTGTGSGTGTGTGA